MTVADAPLLSVVVPVYNGAKTLAACLDSVTRAVAALAPPRRARVEVIVCDNHSTDAGAAIAAAVDFGCATRHISPPAHLPNRTDNWRHGLAAARGDWLLMLHADDGLVPEALAGWLDAIAHPLAAQVGFVAGRHCTFTDRLDKLSAPHPRAFPWPALISGRSLARWVLPLLCPFRPFMLIRRAAYEAVGGFDSTYELAQDWDLWIRLCQRYDVLYVPAVIGAFRYHPTSPPYQRINMAEHMTVLEGLERDGGLPRANRRLARRCMHARVSTVLRVDDTSEARALRRRAEGLVGPRAAGSERELKLAERLVAAELYALRASGALRVALRTRGASPARN